MYQEASTLFWQAMNERLSAIDISIYLRKESPMNPTHQALIINIGHEHEPHIYTVRLKPSNDLLAGFQTIQQLDHWLKMNGGKFTLDPRELPEGWQREAQIATWAYNQMVMARSQAALRQAQDGKAA